MRSFIAGAGILVLAAMLFSCSSPVTPSGGTPGGPKVVGLRIGGPSTIVPGSTAQLSASATYSDGSTKDVTTTVHWLSSDTSILTISASGLASAIQAGEVLISAGLGSVFANQLILIVPAGTFKLSGLLSSDGAPINGALVQVTAGIGAGLSSSTESGYYRLYGVAGTIQLTFTHPLFETITQTVTVNSNTVLDLNMVLIKPLPNFDLEGTYTFRVTADPACPTAGDGALPAMVRERQYTAKISLGGGLPSGLTVALSDANFDSASFNRFVGQLVPYGASFYVNDPEYYYNGYRDIAEALPDGHVYLPSGTINVSPSGKDFVGSLSGSIRVGTLPIGRDVGTIVAQCTSTHHSVTFTNQAGSPARARSRR
jgi:hypothetical protein